jgi:adenosylcobinamide kinase/adenosylcobinamide-phosphate guanylyltransferase
MKPRIALIGGGARSGKSAFALRRALALGQHRAFIATGQAYDDEMRRRIHAHIEERGEDFRTVEAPIDLVPALQGLEHADAVVIDCLTLWLTNLMLSDLPEKAILEQVDALATELQRRRFHTLLVTNEVGMGLVPETPLGRAFRDLAGRAHQRLAAVSDDLYLAVLGTVVKLQPVNEGAPDVE